MDLNYFQQYQLNAILNESNNRNIYGQCNGSHIYIDDDSSTVYGETYLISNGEISLFCKNGESRGIENSKVIK